MTSPPAGWPGRSREDPGPVGDVDFHESHRLGRPVAQDDAPLCSTDVAYPVGVFPEHRGQIVPVVEIGDHHRE
jgi:hypothetical protein